MIRSWAWLGSWGYGEGLGWVRIVEFDANAHSNCGKVRGRLAVTCGSWHPERRYTLDPCHQGRDSPVRCAKDTRCNQDRGLVDHGRIHPQPPPPTPRALSSPERPEWRVAATYNWNLAGAQPLISRPAICSLPYCFASTRPEKTEEGKQLRLVVEDEGKVDHGA